MTDSDTPRSDTAKTDSPRETQKKKTQKLPVLPLFETVVFPHMRQPIQVGRQPSLLAVDEAVKQRPHSIVLLTQQDSGKQDVVPEDLMDVGVLATIGPMFRLPDGSVQLLAQGEQRVKVLRFTKSDPFLEVEVEVIAQTIEPSRELTARMEAVSSREGSMVWAITSTSTSRKGSDLVNRSTLTRCSPWARSCTLPSGNRNMGPIVASTPTSIRSSGTTSCLPESCCVSSTMECGRCFTASSTASSEGCRPTWMGWRMWGKTTVSKSGKTGSFCVFFFWVSR